MIHVQVIMSTYNGEKYLREQLDSIIEQEGVEVSILVRDDGSTDETSKILKEYKEKNQIEYFIGNNIGYGKSFLKAAQKTKKVDYYAFCDQDDIWDKSKLYTAVNLLKKVPNNKPALYFSSLKLVDKNMSFIGIKEYDGIKMDLYSALIRNRAAGCTMVFNWNLLVLANNYDFENYSSTIHHDAWFFRLCAALGGEFIYDNQSYINYRQHDSNVTGVNQNYLKRFKRELSNFKNNKNSRWMISNIILNNYNEYLPVNNKILLKRVIDYPLSLKNTLLLLRRREFRSGIVRADVIAALSVLLKTF